MKRPQFAHTAAEKDAAFKRRVSRPVKAHCATCGRPLAMIRFQTWDGRVLCYDHSRQVQP